MKNRFRKRRYRVACIGELLWDELPAGSYLGGALANCATMIGALGDEAVLVSSVGRDVLGEKAREILAQRPIILDYLGTDASHATGTVSVDIDRGGIATYAIHENVAWDYLAGSSHLDELARRSDAVCFGTLAQRSEVSRTALRSFVLQTRDRCARVFDVNLRSPYISREILAWGMEHATIVKMNHEEVSTIAGYLGAENGAQDTESVARNILQRFPVDMVAITRGSHGSLIVTREECIEHPGIPVAVVDTIGAGDAFTAALTHYYLRKTPLQVLSEAANRWGAWVATQSGGMPVIPPATFARIEAEMIGSKEMCD